MSTTAMSRRLTRLERQLPPGEACMVFACSQDDANEAIAQAEACGQPKPLVFITGDSAHSPAVNVGTLKSVRDEIFERGLRITDKH